jgi:hypothetical protein
VALHPTGQQ